MATYILLPLRRIATLAACLLAQAALPARAQPADIHNITGTKRLTLTDQSVLFLNTATQILVDTMHFNHRIMSSGEIYLEAACEPDTVWLRGAGTVICDSASAVNVKNYPEDSMVTVSVVKGNAVLYYMGCKYLLQAGDIVRPSLPGCHDQYEPARYAIRWISGSEGVCVNCGLREVLNAYSRDYGATIEADLSGRDEKKRYTSLYSRRPPPGEMAADLHANLMAIVNMAGNINVSEQSPTSFILQSTIK